MEEPVLMARRKEIYEKINLRVSVLRFSVKLARCISRLWQFSNSSSSSSLNCIIEKRVFATRYLKGLMSLLE